MLNEKSCVELILSTYKLWLLSFRNDFIERLKVSHASWS